MMRDDDEPGTEAQAKPGYLEDRPFRRIFKSLQHGWCPPNDEIWPPQTVNEPEEELTLIEELIKSSDDEDEPMQEAEEEAVLVIDEQENSSDKRCSTVSGQECEKMTGEQNNTERPCKQGPDELAVNTAEEATETAQKTDTELHSEQTTAAGLHMRSRSWFLNAHYLDIQAHRCLNGSEYFSIPKDHLLISRLMGPRGNESMNTETYVLSKVEKLADGRIL